ncbi:MAG TPA: transglycosylase SLT domain-containing protein [Pseudonocardiaceae bacterium]|jgi:soluble lytic murein transglycosylase-like protein|nr:transglycosylase SLT domain-containing protein [Pseudonocardiaceae bacterium]
MVLSKRATIAVACGTAAVVTVAGVWLVFGMGPNNDNTTLASGDQSLSNSTTTASTAVTTELTTTEVPTTTTVAPTTTRTTTTTKAKAKAPPAHAMPAPVKPPANIPLPPPPHVTPPPGCTATHTGNPASHADVKSALVGAAGTNYWVGVQNPPLVNENPPSTDGSPDPNPVLGPPAVITVPTTLMEAIAWQESGWDSDIKSCDGGNGTMQIQAATATWMNQRYGTNYDVSTLSGNAAIGGEYIEWLIGYFGENSFDHHYDVTDQDMITAVIDAYNAGPGNVQFANGHTVVSHYAATVAALMSQQPWNSN